MTLDLPRYELRSITGYTLGMASGEGKLGTTYWVADRWKCYREVPLLAIKQGRQVYTGHKITTRKAQAERNCERLNAEHEAWLAADSAGYR